MLYPEHLLPISMVYSFRIAQITKQAIVEKSNTHHKVIALLFDQYRKKYNGVFQNYVGGLGSYIYDFESYYFRTDFAASHIKQIIDHVTTFSGNKTDDILFTIGRNFILNNRTAMTCSGLFGIPTHRIFTLQHPDFGYGQLGLGLQWDGSYLLNNARALLYGARYIYFVPRKALDTLDQKHTFTIGNIADLLLAYKNNWDFHHGIEFGYTARFRFGAHIYPNLDDIIKRTNYIRSNFYGVYKYKFIVNNISHRLLFYLSYGFDHRPKIYGSRYIVTLWTSWNVGF